MKKYLGLVKFVILLLLIFVPMILSLHYSTTMQIDEDNIREIDFVYGAGPGWDDMYMLHDRADIEAVVDALEDLELQLISPRKLDNDMLKNELELLIVLWYDDTKQENHDEDINMILIMQDGRIVLNETTGKEHHYKVDDITALQNVLDERKAEAVSGGFWISLQA